MKSQSAFGLVEVLVGITIMSILGLAFSSMILNQQRQVSNLEDRLSKSSLNSVVMSILASGDFCSANLIGEKISLKNKKDIFIKNKSAKVLFKAGDEYDKIKIKKVNLENKSLTPSGLEGLITLGLETLNRNGTDLTPLKYNIKIKLDAVTKNIIWCDGYISADHKKSCSLANVTSTGYKHGDFKFTTDLTHCKTTEVCADGLWVEIAKNCPKTQSGGSGTVNGLHGSIFTEVQGCIIHRYKWDCKSGSCTKKRISLTDNCK